LLSIASKSFLFFVVVGSDEFYNIYKYYTYFLPFVNNCGKEKYFFNIFTKISKFIATLFDKLTLM